LRTLSWAKLFTEYQFILSSVTKLLENSEDINNSLIGAITSLTTAVNLLIKMLNTWLKGSVKGSVKGHERWYWLIIIKSDDLYLFFVLSMLHKLKVSYGIMLYGDIR